MKYLKISIIIFIVLSATYSAAWFYAASAMRKGIEQFYHHDAPQMGIEFFGGEPTITGFPSAPSITYESGFGISNFSITFDKLQFIGFPVPGLPISLEIDDTIIIQDDRTTQNFYLDHLFLTILTPETLPSSIKKQDIALWQHKVGTISVESLKTSRRSMHIHAQGDIGLNDNLQPTINLSSKVTGYTELIRFFVKAGAIKSFAASIAISALNAMAEENPETGEPQVTIITRLQGRTFYLGPVEVSDIPYIEWPE